MHYHQLSFTLNMFKIVMIVDDSFSRLTVCMIVDDGLGKTSLRSIIDCHAPFDQGFTTSSPISTQVTCACKDVWKSTCVQKMSLSLSQIACGISIDRIHKWRPLGFEEIKMSATQERNE